MKRRFVILDRDGTLNVDRHYLSDPNDLELLPGVCRGLRRLQALGMGIIVVTNQSGVARGILDRARLTEIHARLKAMLFAQGIKLDGIYVCPHHPEEGCRCRKRATGLVEQAVFHHGFDPGTSFVIGDRDSDIDCGRNLGAFTILVRTGQGEEERYAGKIRPNAICDDLCAAALLIQQRLGTDSNRPASPPDVTP